MDHFFKIGFICCISLFIAFCTSDSHGKDDTKTDDSNVSPEQTSYAPSVQTSLKIIIPDTSASKGSSLCLDVSVEEFKSIVSIQHSINWDPKVLRFIKVQDFQLPGLTESSFGLTETELGKCGISWYDPSVKGISLANGKPIYQICFELTGSSGSESPVRITSDPVMIEVSNAASRILGIPSGKGRIQVD